MATIDLTIDIQAIVSNYKQLQLRAKTQNCGAVVKAEMYGLRAYPALQRLLEAGCRTFFVATAQEAASISSHVDENAEVLILNRDAPIQRGISVVNSLSHAAQVQSIQALHVDIGMNRWGLSMDDLAQVDVHKFADGCLILSHFSEAEVPDSQITLAQIKRYRELIQSLENRLPSGKTIRTSLANSAGMFVPNTESDVPRPGYALYGGNPMPWTANPMQAVVTLKAPIAQVRRTKTGQAVGYGSTWTASQDSWLATVGLGYADGWPRNASGSGLVRFRDRLVPIVGRVSMDSVVVDCGEQQPELGEYITLVDDSVELCIDAVAQRADTIGYEVLTRLGNRYTRHHV